MTSKSYNILPTRKSSEPIEQAIVKQLHDLGFKLITLASSGKPATKWSHTYEHPEDISPEKLTEDNSPIRGIATIFGCTRLTGTDGKPYYLCGFDCDSETIADVFNAPIVRQSSTCTELAKICSGSVMMSSDSGIADIVTMLCSSNDTELTLLDVLKRITYVTKSRKSHGFHFYWLEQELYPAIHSRDCKKDCNFEIKTDKSSSALTLPPSTHRNDAEFRYYAIGRTDRIAPLPGLYWLLTENILGSCLDDKKKERRGRTEHILQGDGDTPNSMGKEPAVETSQSDHLGQDCLIPSATTINNNVSGRFQILNSEKEDRIVSLLLPSYKPGFRNEICFALSGGLFVYGVSQPNTNKIIASLCDQTNDPEKESRLTVAQNTYTNGIAGRLIAGTGALVEILAHIIGDVNAAYESVSKIIETINAPERNVLTFTKTIRNSKPTSGASGSSRKPADDAVVKYQQLILRSPSIRKNPVDFILSSILKEAREEQLLGKQLLITMLSAYTKNPLNMCINAPSGEGKNYVISRVFEYFPSDDVIVYAGMTDKALFHRRGELVVKNPETKQYEPLIPKLAVIKQALAEREKRLSELTQENIRRGTRRKAKNEISDKDAETTSDVSHNESDNDSPSAKQTIGESSSSDILEGKEEEIQSLRKEILRLGNTRTQLFKQAKKLINLENKILIFLDTPNSSLLSALMPLLSHDKYEVEYEFVDTSDGIETRTNLLQGWPAVIFAQALDITRDKRYPEIQRRFITTNPKMVPKKYKQAINLIGSKFGLPDLAYQAEVISNKEKKMVKVVIEALKQSLFDFNKNQEPGKNNVLIPYHTAVSGSLPGQKAFDMTIAYRLFTYLSLLPLIHKDRRPKLLATLVQHTVKEGDDGNSNSDWQEFGDDETTKDLQPETQVVPFATFDDLQEAISLMEYGDGTKPYVLEWYREVFLPTFNAKKNPDFKVDVKRNQRIEESKVAVTTEQLKEPTKKYTGRNLSTQQLLERYIYPLLNIGYVDSKDSEINHKAKIYWPILSSDNISLFEKSESNNNLSHLKLHLGKNMQFPNKNYLISAIWRITGYYSDKGYCVKMVDADDDQQVLTIEQLVEQYYSNPEDYFHRANTDSFNENSNDTKESSDQDYSAGVHSAKGRVSASSTITVVIPQNSVSEEQGAKAQDPQESHSITISEQEFAKSDNQVSTKTFVVEKTNVRICALDLEWLQQPDNTSRIFAAGFVDNNGWNEALHASEYGNSEPELVKAIVDRVNQLSVLSVGWFTTGPSSDLMVLHERCIANGIESPVDISSGLFPRLKRKNHIDLYRIFEKELVKSSIFENKYRSLKLEEVAQALLGKGKHDGITGANVAEASLSAQKQYVLQDARLALELAQVNDGQVLDLMHEISELIDMDFEQVCHTGLSSWWAHVFDSMGCERPPFELQLTDGSRYEGGLILEPKTGNYENVMVVDVASLYPTVAILHNISFDTINCDCCKDRLDARVVLNDHSIDAKGYWICKQKEGAFPSKLRGYREERLRQKKLGNKVKDRGLKILINGGYGVFGYPGFKYFDKRVAELITAYGRHTLLRMQELARGHGFDIIAGDTDSLFLSGANNTSLQQFLNKCHQALTIEVEHQRTFSKFLNIKKKHYIGIDSVTGDSVVKGMEGKKSDRPRWVTRVFEQFVQDFNEGKDPTINIKTAINDLEARRVNPEDLKIFVTLSKNPAEYVSNTIQKRVGLHFGAKKGDTIYYYKTDANINKKEDVIPMNAEDISISEYKKLLLATLKDALEIMGHSFKDGIALDIFNISGDKKQKDLKDMPMFGRQHESVGDMGKTT